MIEQKENKFSLCDRILQTLSVFTFMSMIFLTISSGLLLLALCFSYYTCWIPILYFIWYIYDFNTSEKVIFYIKMNMNLNCLILNHC